MKDIEEDNTYMKEYLKKDCSFLSIMKEYEK